MTTKERQKITDEIRRYVLQDIKQEIIEALKMLEGAKKKLLKIVK